MKLETNTQKQLNQILSEMSSSSSLFSADSSRDFSRNRILNFKHTLTIILGMAGGSLNKDIYDYFKCKSVMPTASAFVQARAKILPEAFQYLFAESNREYNVSKKYKGYQLLAADGTALNIPKNPLDEETYLEQGFNQLHINALYDLLDRVYIDVQIQGKRKTNKIEALCQMIRRHKFVNKSILMADRGYECFNLFELCNRTDNLDYLIRVKNKGTKEIAKLPLEEFDKDISIEIRTTQTKSDLEAYKEGKAHYVSGKSRYGKYKISQTWDFESKCVIKLRVVRFKITENTYETIVTFLNRFEFDNDEIKHLYHLRWGIETSFRELKYDLGLVNLHSKRKDFIIQEIWVRLTMYNFAERIIQSVVIKQDNNRK